MVLAAIALSVAYIATYLVTPVAGRLAHRIGILDAPDGRKIHDRAIPYLGGVAIVTGVFAGAAVLLVRPESHSPIGITKFGLGMITALGLAIVGVIDDARNLPRVVRIGFQVAAAVAAWIIGFRVTATPWEWMNIAITLFWIVGITNAFNLLDNMDGLSSGLAAIGAAAFAGLGVLGDLPVLGTVAAALCGASLGFLPHNRHPAKVFMGDAGSLFIGFLLALIGISLQFDNLVEVTFLIPLVVLGIPIFDTTLVVITRWSHSRSPFMAGTDHVSHRLVRVGIPVKAAVGILYWTQICLAWLGIVISRSNVEVGWMLLGFVAALGVFFGFLLWKIPAYPDESGAVAVAQEPVDPEQITVAS